MRVPESAVSPRTPPRGRSVLPSAPRVGHHSHRPRIRVASSPCGSDERRRGHQDQGRDQGHSQRAVLPQEADDRGPTRNATYPTVAAKANRLAESAPPSLAADSPRGNPKDAQSPHNTTADAATSELSTKMTSATPSHPCCSCAKQVRHRGHRSGDRVSTPSRSGRRSLPRSARPESSRQNSLPRRKSGPARSILSDGTVGNASESRSAIPEAGPRRSAGSAGA